MESLVIDSSSGYNKGMSRTVSVIPEIDLAELCKDVETATGYTANDMAQALGASLQAYYRWRSDDRDPSGQFTAKLFLLVRSLEKQGKQIPIKIK
jgi:DNA-binding XRE family transcriptional regulator